mmetsp:Transcript_23542/g.38682  ORF Transcript_23542/g.38682 Transcript_23542/m.38682 type:complete len:86 (-) Transcript_23542:1222-1479(-)
MVRAQEHIKKSTHNTRFKRSNGSLRYVTAFQKELGSIPIKLPKCIHEINTGLPGYIRDSFRVAYFNSHLLKNIYLPSKPPTKPNI